MNTNITFIFIVAGMLFGLNKGYAQMVEYRSFKNGMWSEPNSWQKKVGGVWVSSDTYPNQPISNNQVIIQKGHTISITGLAYCTSLNIEPGSVLEGNAASTLQIGNGANPDNFDVILKNDGLIKSPNSSEGFLNIEIADNTSEVLITGIGVYQIGSLKAIGGNLNTLHVIINQDLTISAQTGELALSACYIKSKNTDKYSFTINPDKTVSIKNGAFHAVSDHTGNHEAGVYTYNIKGTLDLSTNLTTHCIPFSGNQQSAVEFNISGLLKTGKKLNAVNGSSTAETGKAIFLIEYGGVVDATETEELTMGKTYFITRGTGTLKRKVGNTDTPFPIGVCFLDSYTCTSQSLQTISGTYNPLILNNPEKEGVFSVNVNTTFESPVPDSAIVVKREWFIDTDETANNVQVKLGWSAGDEASKFKSDSVSIIRYDGTSWNESNTLLTAADTGMYYVKAVFNNFGKFGIQNSITLPIELLQFSAELSSGLSKEVNLKWKHTNENLIKQFNIERSVDGQNYDSIGVVNSIQEKGTHYYSFDDIEPKYGISYYRLKLIRIDETFEYSEQQKIENILDIPFSIYPNPVTNYLTVIHPTAKQESSMQIISVDGKRVLNLFVDDEDTKRSLDISNLNPGVYILIFKNDSQNHVLKFLKR
jgi:hypothetical protein